MTVDFRVLALREHVKRSWSHIILDMHLCSGLGRHSRMSALPQPSVCHFQPLFPSLLLLGGDTCLALMAGSSLVYGATGSIMWTGRLLVQEVLCSG
jgi:hypothetical protein